MTVIPLLATVLALMSGPVLFGLAQRRPAFLSFLDGFVLVSISGLVLLEVLPESYEQGGMGSLIFVLAGALGPSLVERTLHQARREAHLATLGLAVVGLLLHSLADGAAMSPAEPGHDGHGHARHALALAIVVHSVPVGLVIWWEMRPVFGARLPLVALVMMSLATIAGYLFGIEFNHFLGERAIAWFEALVAGSILHVVFGRPHLEEDSVHRAAPPPWEGLGNLAAVIGLAALNAIDPHGGPLHHVFNETVALLAPMAPGFLFAVLLLAMLRYTRGGQTLPSDISAMLLASAVALPVLGWKFTAIFSAAALFLWGLLQVPGLRRVGGAPEPHSVQRSQSSKLLAEVNRSFDQSAPWLLLGTLLAGITSVQLGAQWTPPIASAALIAIAAILAGVSRLHPLAGVPLACVLMVVSGEAGMILAVLLAGSRDLQAGLLSRAVRVVAACAAGWGASNLALDPAVPELAASMAVDAGPGLILLAILMTLSLLRKGSRSWVAQIVGESEPHTH